MPFMRGYVDNADNQNPRPHIHAVIISKTSEASEYLKNPNKIMVDWLNKEPRGTIHSRQIQGYELKDVAFYASKTYRKIELINKIDAFDFVFPDHVSDNWWRWAIEPQP